MGNQQPGGSDWRTGAGFLALLLVPWVVVPWWLWRWAWPQLGQLRWRAALTFAPMVAYWIVGQASPGLLVSSLRWDTSINPSLAHNLWVLLVSSWGATLPVLAYGSPLFALVAAFVGSPGPARTSHGSARWASTRDLVAGLVTPGDDAPGVMLGRVGRPGRGRDARFRTRAHVLTVAPTGSGKGIGGVIPNLLSYRGSVVVLDPKGEVHAVTARRRRELGQRVVVVDPFKLTGAEPASLDLLGGIDPKDEACVGEAAALIDALVVRSPNAEPHWDDTAGSLLLGLALHVAGLEADRRHLGTVRELLTLPQFDQANLLGQLSQGDEAFGVVARSARMQLGREERERSSVLSTAARHTAWLDDPRLVRSVAGRPAGFQLGALKREPVTLYLCIPPDKLQAYKGWVRVVLGEVLASLVREQAKPALPVLVVFDEVAQLGHFRPLEDGVGILRGYGAQLWMLAQDLSQLEGVYPRWRTFLANCTLQAFGTHDLTTAEHLSKLCGEQTIAVQSVSKSHEVDGHDSTSTSETGRALLTPDEVRRLAGTEVLVVERGLPVARLGRLNYLTDPEHVGQFDSNPMHLQLEPARAPKRLPG